jgi:hypothetical protein
VTTMAQAKNEIAGAFRDQWIGGPLSAELPVLYRDVGDKPPTSGAWARLTIRHSLGGQATLAGDSGTRHYRHTGFVTVQVFAERHDRAGAETTLDALVTIAKHAFEGITTSPGRVAFHRVRVNEVGVSGVWLQTNVLADFEYDEVR